MLVFKLGSGETFHIGDKIHIRIVKLGGTHVQVGIEAPTELAVDRDKVRMSKLREILEKPA